MNRPHGNRARLGGALLAVAAALAILVLPSLASSHGRHHHDDHGDAGTIQSFDPATGVLTIDLANGGSVSGLVVRRTHIHCGRGHGHHHGLRPGLLHRPGPGSDDSADLPSRGPGEDPQGDEKESDNDHEGRGPEAGEGPPGHDGTAPGRSEGPGKGAKHSHRCDTDDLVAGATVEVAELVLIDGSAFYKLVELDKHDHEDEDEPEPGDV